MAKAFLLQTAPVPKEKAFIFGKDSAIPVPPPLSAPVRMAQRREGLSYALGFGVMALGKRMQREQQQQLVGQVVGGVVVVRVAMYE